MDGPLLPIPLDQRIMHFRRKPVAISKKTLFGKKDSDEWHEQIDFTAGVLHPSDHRFPWQSLRKHTNEYLKKKGRITQQDADIRLAILIEAHENRHVALAASVHAMSPASVRALLNVRLNVTSVTYYGLESYLQSLIAVNYCNPRAVNDLEAQWALQMLSYTSQGGDAAGRYLEGFITMLSHSDLTDMSLLPDFALLAQQACQDFASQLEGLRLRCQWIAGHSLIAWLTRFRNDIPRTVTSGRKLAMQILDSNLPVWRIWSCWKPKLDRLNIFDSLSNEKRAILPDIMALEGPDFVAGNHKTLRDGLIAQYGEAKPIVRFQNLIMEVPECTKQDLKKVLELMETSLSDTLKGSESFFDIFVQLVIARPVSVDAFPILNAIGQLRDTADLQIQNAMLEIWTSRSHIGGRHIGSLSHLIQFFEQPEGEKICEIMLQEWLVEGIKACIQECREAVQSNIDTGSEWDQFVLELHAFYLVIKQSKKCDPLLEDKLKQQLRKIPSADVLSLVLDMYVANGGDRAANTASNGHAFYCAVTAYMEERMLGIESATTDRGMQKILQSALKVWLETKDNKRRELAIVATRSTGMDSILRCRCLAQVVSLDDTAVNDLLEIIGSGVLGKGEMCIKFTRLLARTDNMDMVQCWRGILYQHLSVASDDILHYIATHFDAWEWSSFMLDVYALFVDLIIDPKAAPPPVLKVRMHEWVQELSKFMPAITRLEEYLGTNRRATQTILQGGDDHQRRYYLSILNSLTKAMEQPVEKIMQLIAGRVANDLTKMLDIDHCLQSLLATTQEGADACQRVIDLFLDPEADLFVVETILAGWVQDEDICSNDITALKSIAAVLELEIFTGCVPNGWLEATSKYFLDKERAILKEADRLDDLKIALRHRDPVGTAQLLEQLGIVDTSPLDEELESLPMSIIHSVEKRGNSEVEMSFPLTSLTSLQRAAMGANDANTLFVRLFLDFTGNVPTAFCIHLDNEFDDADADIEHISPWVPAHERDAPELVYCRGRNSALTWQLNRVLHRIIIEGITQIATLYDLISKSLLELAHSCMVCGFSHCAQNAQLRRSTHCTLLSCSRIWNNMPLEIRVPELRSDIFAIDMLLTSVYAAAMSTRMELLPGCPIKTTHLVVTILNALPPLTILRDAVHLSLVLREYHHDAEELLTWACTHFRGFITTAKGNYKVPGLPVGTHQFILANASPDLETKFASNLSSHNPSTRILFHGTALDRLPAILAQGLQNKSGTALQRTGAAYGKGVYLAEEPATSFGYSPSAVSWRNSNLSNMRLLLGCEVVGNGNLKKHGIHVINDEKHIIVRYVFLMTNGAHAPVSQHLVPAMSSTIAGLRSGAL